MIISHILGGVGNQMFQYAAGRALSIKTNQEFLLDLRDFASYPLHQGFELNRAFNVLAQGADESTIRDLLGWKANHLARRILRRSEFTWLRGRHFVNEPHFNCRHGFFNLTGDAYLSGYWQSEQYFKQIENIIRSDFTFRELLSGRNAELASKIADTQSVSLHVRRGDYISDPKTGKIMNSCSIAYYRAAIDWLAERLQNPVFYVFSDDMAWVRQNLTMVFPCHYIDHNRAEHSYRDMQLMSLCQHHVIANSSFSWWGAWLNANPDKLVVAPKTWFSDDRINDGDLIPRGWIRL